MGRLIKEAYYQWGDNERYAAHMAEHARMIGDTHALHYLRENFGIGLPTDEDFSKLVEKLKREDPHGIKSLLLVRMIEAEKESEEYKRLEQLYDRYTKLTPEQRAADRVAGDFFCLAVHGKSIFDYEKGKSPWDA